MILSKLGRGICSQQTLSRIALSKTPRNFTVAQKSYTKLRHDVRNLASSSDAIDDSGRYKVATIPNAICVARIAATPLIGYLVVTHAYTSAFWLFIIAGASDLADGWIARNMRGQASLLGSVLDPIADKLLVSTMFITLSHAGLIPVPLTSIVILRDVCLIFGGFYKRYQTMEPPYSLNRFFNPQVSSMQVVPTMMSKLNTVLQLSIVALSLASPVFGFSQEVNQAVLALGCATAFTTVYSGIQYAGGKAFKKIR